MTNQQIVSLYETSNLSLNELAEVFSMEEAAIKVALVQGSNKYREELKKDPTLFNSGDLAEATQTMVQLLTSDQPNVKFRAAKFIINETQGRHNVIKNVQQLNINVNLFNDNLRRAKEAKQRALGVIQEAEEINQEKQN